MALHVRHIVLDAKPQGDRAVFEIDPVGHDWLRIGTGSLNFNLQDRLAVDLGLVVESRQGRFLRS